jgi:hypothetical protein
MRNIKLLYESQKFRIIAEVREQKRKRFPGLAVSAFSFYCFRFALNCSYGSRYAYEVRHVIFHLEGDFAFMGKVNEFVRMPAALAWRRSLRS